MTGAEVRLARVRKSFRAGTANEIHALRGVDLAVASGDFLVLVGHNGCGKSTLLNIVGADATADAGDVSVVGVIPDGIAMIFQDPARNVVRELSVAENLALATLASPFPSPVVRSVTTPLPAAQVHSLARIGLSAKIDEPVSALSYGQQQLLALEMVLLRSPRLLLLDEPTASLDRVNAARCFGFIDEIWRVTAATIILVTHDLTAALQLGNRLVAMRDGIISADYSETERATLTLTELLETCGLVQGVSERAPLEG